ncbi:MAG: PIN domain-containing protein [Gemmatimonadetes bacterium]|nr:PIN domain-containing protein [Gemmatimonadota bacterium]
MNAVDANLLVYAHREECQWHPQARDCLANLAASPAPWAIPGPCVHEFLAIATHPRIYDPPTPTAIALDQVRAWLETPNLVLLAESPGFWDKLHRLIETGRIAGPMVHDARVAALCLHHGVETLLTADRDFSRFPGLRVRNPLPDA